jgi:hypothetical protein
MSQDNSIEYTIEEKEGGIKSSNEPVFTRNVNGLSGIPPDVASKLPPGFFDNEPQVEQSDAFIEFMLKHKASLQGRENIDMHPTEYFEKIVKKTKQD